MNAAEWLEYAYQDRIDQLRSRGIVNHHTPGEAYGKMFRTTRAYGLASMKNDHETELFGGGKPYCGVCSDTGELIVIE